MSEYQLMLLNTAASIGTAEARGERCPAHEVLRRLPADEAAVVLKAAAAFRDGALVQTPGK